MKYFRQMLCLVLLLWTAAPALAEEGKEEKLDISHIVLEHIKDSYEWHVTDIGDRLGFSSIEHFSAAFRQAMGCSPRQYRQRRRGTAE